MRRAFSHLQMLRILARGWLIAALLGVAAACAQGIELTTLQLARVEGDLALEYNLRARLSNAVEDALQRGVPMYFIAEATLFRKRWYWRDERVGHVARSWRLSYQPLTSSWRLSLGGLARTFGSLPEALASMSRVSGWPLVEVDRLDSAERYYVEFSWRLDNSQLPQPMQIDLGSDWKLGIERTLRVDKPE